MPGPLDAALRDGGLISAVGVPIVVEGSIWGFMTAGARPAKPTHDGTEERLARFTELVATAIADSQAREQLAQLASEQAALRRVATMVARESPPAEVFGDIAPAPASEQLFSAVAREVASVLDVPGVIVTRYEPDGTAVTVGEAFGVDLAGAEQSSASVRQCHQTLEPSLLWSSTRTIRRGSTTYRHLREQSVRLRGRRNSVPVVRVQSSSMEPFGADVRLLAGRNGTSRGNRESPPRLHRPRCDGDRELRGARRVGSVGGARSRASRRAGGLAAGGHAGGPWRQP